MDAHISTFTAGILVLFASSLRAAPAPDEGVVLFTYNQPIPTGFPTPEFGIIEPVTPKPVDSSSFQAYQTPIQTLPQTGYQQPDVSSSGSGGSFATVDLQQGNFVSEPQVGYQQPNLLSASPVIYQQPSSAPTFFSTPQTVYRPPNSNAFSTPQSGYQQPNFAPASTAFSAPQISYQQPSAFASFSPAAASIITFSQSAGVSTVTTGGGPSEPTIISASYTVPNVPAAVYGPPQF